MITTLLVLSWVGCSGPDTSTAPDTTPVETNPQAGANPPSSTLPTQQAVQPVFEQAGKQGNLENIDNLNNLDKGQKHPPLPADNPAWEWDAQGFVPDFGWFGEHNWSDVRMRVVGHLAMGFRDLARFHLLNQDWTMALQTNQRAIQTLSSINTEPSKFAEEIRSILIQSFKRDAQILQALQGQAAFPETNPDTLIHWRIAIWKLQQQPASTNSEIAAIQSEIQQRFATPKVSAIDDFDNFTDRHKLRTELFQAYVDSLDPLLPTDLRWGYWRPAEIQRQAAALWMTLEAMKSPSSLEPSKLFVPIDWWYGNDTLLLQHPFTTTVASLKDTNPIFTSSYYSLLIRDQQADFSAEQFGRLPTGDSIIDVGGQPGPMGIGTLMKLDVSDDTHHAWLTQYGNTLQELASQHPDKAVATCQQAISELNAYTHGSRFYNVKQFRNACTRQLARLGHYAAAKTIFDDSFPLHHQDWACPNREGLLLVILGRLTALSESTPAGLDVLERAIQSGLGFLQQVDQAEQGLLTEPKPPMMKGPPPPNGKGPHGQINQHRGPQHPPQPVKR